MRCRSSLTLGQSSPMVSHHTVTTVLESSYFSRKERKRNVQGTWVHSDVCDSLVSLTLVSQHQNQTCCSGTGTSRASHRQGRVQHLLTGLLLTILSTLLWMVNQLVPLPFNSSRHFQPVPAHSTRVPCFGPQGTSCGSRLLHFLLLRPLTMAVTSLWESLGQKPGEKR